eukprot:SAG31_NODE_747_length_12395_cov_129.196405_9_plen_85_part_00
MAPQHDAGRKFRSALRSSNFWRWALEVGGGNGSWLVELAELEEGRLCVGSTAGKWAEIGVSASLSKCCDRLHRVCCLCFGSGVF